MSAIKYHTHTSLTETAFNHLLCQVQYNVVNHVFLGHSAKASPCTSYLHTKKKTSFSSLPWLYSSNDPLTTLPVSTLSDNNLTRTPWQLSLLARSLITSLERNLSAFPSLTAMLLPAFLPPFFLIKCAFCGVGSDFQVLLQYISGYKYCSVNGRYITSLFI